MTILSTGLIEFTIKFNYSAIINESTISHTSADLLSMIFSGYSSIGQLGRVRTKPQPGSHIAHALVNGAS